MAIYTPRGLKIRLAVEYSFGLMARLSPDVDAFKVIKTTEALESLPAALAFVAGIVCFFGRLDPLLTAIWVSCLCVYGCVAPTFGSLIFPREMLSLGLVYSNLSGFGILLMVLALVGYFTAGYLAVVGYVAGRLLGGLVNGLIESWNGRRIFRATGDPLWGSEINFLSAYRWHASRLGRKTDLELSLEEREGGAWKTCLVDFAAKWPEVAQRFTVE